MERFAIIAVCGLLSTFAPETAKADESTVFVEGGIPSAGLNRSVGLPIGQYIHPEQFIPILGRL
jgi:hypothetical protein